MDTSYRDFVREEAEATGTYRVDKTPQTTPQNTK